MIESRTTLQQAEGVSEHISKGVTPNVLIGGPVPILPGFPIKPFGNDGSKKSRMKHRRKFNGGLEI